MIEGQMSIFDWLGESQGVSFKAGDTTQDVRYVGRIIPWSELISMWIGRPVWYRVIMDTWDYYQLVIPERALIKKIPYYSDGVKKMSDRVICYDGTKQRALIDEWHIRTYYKYPCSNAFYEVANGWRDYD